MVLESNPVYDAIQIVSENGYAVIDEGFLEIALPLGILLFIGIGMIIGYFIGRKSKLEGVGK